MSCAAVSTSMFEQKKEDYHATESYFPEFKAATLEMIRAQGAIVGWTASFAQLKDAWRD